MKAYCISVCLLCLILKKWSLNLTRYHDLSLSNVLLTAGFTSYAVDEIGTFATNVVFARLFLAGGGALECALTP